MKLRTNVLTSCVPTNTRSYIKDKQCDEIWIFKFSENNSRSRVNNPTNPTADKMKRVVVENWTPPQKKQTIIINYTNQPTIWLLHDTSYRYITHESGALTISGEKQSDWQVTRNHNTFRHSHSYTLRTDIEWNSPK